MAEIRVEEKKRNLGWLWALIALIIVALLIWYFMAGANDVTPPVDPGVPGPGASLTEPRVVERPLLAA